MFHEMGSKVVQRLLTKVSLFRRQPQSVVPQQVELQMLKRLFIGQ